MNTARNRYLSDDHEDFTVSRRESIVAILRELAERNITLSGAFNNGSEVLLTAVMGVDADAGCAYLDVNANEERNRDFAYASRVIFFAHSGGAKIQWSTTDIERAEYQGYKAFRIPLPEKLQRVQRRNSFRVGTPLGHPLICHIPVAADREVALPLVDLSVEGIGVMLPEPVDPAIEKNARFANCRIEHADLALGGLTLDVQSIWEVTLANGTTSKRAGLEFVDLPRNVEATIQRYVYKLERQKVAMR